MIGMLEKIAFINFQENNVSNEEYLSLIQEYLWVIFSSDIKNLTLLKKYFVNSDKVFNLPPAIYLSTVRLLLSFKLEGEDEIHNKLVQMVGFYCNPYELNNIKDLIE